MKRKKLLSVFLSIALVFTMLPAMAFAESETTASAKDAKAKIAELIADVDFEQYKSVVDGTKSKKDTTTSTFKVNKKATSALKAAKKELSSASQSSIAVNKKKAIDLHKSSDMTYPVANYDQGYVYGSLQYAVDESLPGDTLTLLTDLQSEGAIIADKDIIIDMNEHYIGGTYTDAMLIISDSSVKLQNGYIMNVGTGNGVGVVGYSEVYMDDMSFTTDSDDTMSVLVGEDAYVQVANSGFLNGSILDAESSEVAGVVANKNSYVDVYNTAIAFDEGYGIMGAGNVNVLESAILMEDGIGIAANTGGQFVISEGNYLARYAIFSVGGKVKIHEGTFESEYLNTPAITSNGTNHGTNITIATGSVARPANWKTVTKDFIAVIKDMAKPANTKVNLSGSYNKIKATWSKVTGAKGYAVYYKKGTGSYKLWGRTTNKYATIKNLTGGSKYTVKVVPYKLCEGIYDKIQAEGTKYATATTYTLKKVVLKSTFKKVNGKVQVRWNNISGETGYQISKSTKKTGTNIVSTYKTTTGSYKNISATKGKGYYYKVRAYKVVNGSKIFAPWSSVKYFKR